MKLEQRLSLMMDKIKTGKMIEGIYHAKDKGKFLASLARYFEKDIEELHNEVLKGSRYIEKTISAEQAVQICTICLMSGLDDIDLIMNYEILPEAMEQPCTSLEYREVAKKMQFFLLTGHLFSNDRTMEELIEIFFGS